MTKKRAPFLVILVLSLATLAGCGGSSGALRDVRNATCAVARPACAVVNAACGLSDESP